jgi:adenine-specific DNA-methyltransferase
VTNKKLTGSFYTPQIIAEFMVDYLADKLNEKSKITILEPSAGDGIFIKTIFKHLLLSSKIKKIVAVEKNKTELNKIQFPKKYFSGVHSDFLQYQKNNVNQFSLVIGNPPYIKKNFLTEKQITSCKAIHHNASLADTTPKNIWTAFLVRCMEFTSDDGILAFVLPSELLQVKFAEELRELVLQKFERVEIFTFNQLLFKDCKGQDTILLIGEKKSEQKGIFYSNIEKTTDLKQRNFTLSQNTKVREAKWTHQHLNSDEIELLSKIKNRLGIINNYCTSKAGIVTAANNYFIVNADKVKEYSLEKYVKPIIQKGIFVNGSAVLTRKEFKLLVDNCKPTYLIALDQNSKIRSNHRINEYLKIGIEQHLNLRYKTLLRENWCEVPNIGSPPEAFFFKRCNEYPKLIKNSASVLATDSAYVITMKEGYDINNLIFSFYNSLTLSFAELNGRYYGGGVLELTPNEFKNLPVPYINRSIKDFNSFLKEFKGKSSIMDICKIYDREILKSIDKDLDDDSIDKIFKIREKLYLRRIKTN